MNRPEVVSDLVRDASNSAVTLITLPRPLCAEALAYIAHLEARVKELEAANEWQPIETAPRDGSRILAYQSSTGDCISECWWQEDLTDYWAGWVNDFDSDPEPTHWRPLPSPPEGV